MPTKNTRSEIQKPPKLRFVGFSGAWEEKKLGEVAAKPMYGMNAAAKEYDGENIYLRITDIDENTGRLKKDTLTSPDGILEESYKLKEGDLLFTRTGASVGKTYLYKKTDGKLYFAGFLIKFSIEKAHPFFVYLLTLQKKYSKFVESVSMRSGQPGINAHEYSGYKINLPTLPEQKKIADFFGAADAWIENLRAQKENLESYKKGIMQKIFPSISSGQAPQIRFKDEKGKAFPKWEEKKLGEVCEYKNGGAFENNLIENGKYNLITLNSLDITGKLKKHHKTVGVADWYLKKDDLVMVLSDVAHGNFLGLVDVIPEDDKYVLNQRMGLLRKKDGNIDLNFLRSYINKKQTYFKLHGQGSSQQNLSKGDILKFKIPSPTLPEQQKITDFLTSVDKVIESKQQQITQAKTWKKGLMQGLFV